MKIIGIGGLPRSGKDTLADFLMRHGYFGVSLGDIVRDASKKRHAEKKDPISIEHMTETANSLRAAHGPDFALKIALDTYRKACQHRSYKGLVVYSVRAPAEVDFIRAQKGMLIWVSASDHVRHQRFLQHLRKGEVPLSLDEMRTQEALQARPQPNVPVSAQMDISYVKRHATHILSNDRTDIDAFLANAASLIEKGGL